VDPKNVLKNGGAQAGDRLLLTKALGTGVISTAIKKGVAKQAWIDAAVKSMTTLNKIAVEVITANHVGAGALTRPATQSPAANDQRPTTNDVCPIHALTDITGFGLIGHLREMLLASQNVSAKLYARMVPALEGALDCVRAGHIPAGLKANREFAECTVQYKDGIADEIKTLLFDPQTAGGLLISVGADVASDVKDALNKAGVPAVEIGEIAAGSKPLIEIA
jgi:selenide,water dikinase